MKMTNKKIALILVSVAVLFSVVGYVAKAANLAYSSGYMILLDRNADENYVAFNNYSTTVYLPSSNCDGFANICSYEYPEGTFVTADINKDGRIDYADFELLKGAYSCEQTGTCDKTFTLWECYFTYDGGYFKDPSGDCFMNQTDFNIISLHMDATGVSDGNDAYSSDLNHDGTVNILDVALAGMNNGKYATVFKNYGCIKQRAADVNGDGKVDILDAAKVGTNFGKKASIQICKTAPLKNLGEGKYRIDDSGFGMYSVGVGFRCIPV